MLLAAALAAAGGATRAQEGGAAAARALERFTAASAAQAKRARVEQLRSAARAEAHAGMPSTMYASTPDPAPPPHAVPVDAGTESVANPLQVNAASGSAASRTHRIALFPSASRQAGEMGYQGFARITNRSDGSGTVEIDAYDDEGNHHGPLTLDLDPGATVHFNSDDLEEGNPDKGLTGATGAGSGDWRLELRSTLDIQALAYIRTKDGFLTSMHDVVPFTDSGHRVVTFNPGSNRNQVSWLRIVNPGAEPAEVRIEGFDDRGQSPGEVIVVSAPARGARMLSSAQLEAGEGEGVTGGTLGTGTGKWQLVVSSDQPIEVMSLLTSPTGHRTNLSTVPDNAESSADGATTTHTVGLFPAAADPGGRQGFVRLINRSELDGEVKIEAIDDAGEMRGPATLEIDAGRTIHFNSGDLENGNDGKDLSDGVGAPGSGNWRLRLSSTLDLQVLAYIRTEDGFLTSMHDVAPANEAERRVVTFNPGKNVNQESLLRLVNPGEAEAEVRIEGVDDDGRSPGEEVVVAVPAGASRTLGAAELESGDGAASGALGKGKGKWRLAVTADRPIEVMSLLSSPTGHLTNLSTAPGPAVPVATAGDVFRDDISGPVVQAKCVSCHVEGGVSGHTNLVFVRSTDPDHEAKNLEAFKDYIAEVDDGAKVVLDKIRGGRSHGGGQPIPAGTPEFESMERFLRLLGEDVAPVTLTPQTLFDTVEMAPTRKVLRRAALIFAGRIPTAAEHAAAQQGSAALRSTIRGLMTGPEFHEFLIRGANDRLLTDRDWAVLDVNDAHFVDFTNEHYRRLAAAEASNDPRDLADLFIWLNAVQHGAGRAPLELIARVVENDLPYTEILTADYIMANPEAAAAYGASTRFDDPDNPYEFRPSRIERYFRKGDGFESEYDPILLTTRVLDPGPLITDYPHAGILNTTVFLRRYPTTATNRNRARSRWTYYHFLGLDIEKSASRTTDPDALADTNNPTMHNPACTVCHTVMDPVAGAFQNYGDVGLYKDQWGGVDALDGLYKHGPEERRDGDFLISARSWGQRQTFSKIATLTKDRSSVRLSTSRDFQPSPGDEVWWNLAIGDRLTIRDAEGNFVKHQSVGDPECGRWHNEGGRRFFEMYFPCGNTIPLEVPVAGIYRVEMEAWILYWHRDVKDLPVELAMDIGELYRDGDTWYRDMRVPGFGSDLAPSSDNSVQWLARRIVADDRFAEATVEFWWPAIMGSEVAEPPEDEEDPDFEGRLLAASAQELEVQRLARGFRRGFQGGQPYNLKDLLVEIVLSPWFRADAVEDDNPIRLSALRDAGARRLLTPEELARKTAAVTGVQWGRHISFGAAPQQFPNALSDDYRLLYGGIDSGGITERARDITSVMAGVAERHAVQTACLIVMRDLYLLPDAKRRLFAGMSPNVTPARGGDTAIRNKLVELHDKLLGVEVTPHSEDVEGAYQLFADVVKNGPRSRDDWFSTYGWFATWECEWWNDLFLFEGILDEPFVERMNEDGWRWYQFDNEVVDDLIESTDWSDPYHAARAWVVVLAFLMSDYRYLYL